MIISVKFIVTVTNKYFTRYLYYFYCVIAKTKRYFKTNYSVISSLFTNESISLVSYPLQLRSNKRFNVEPLLGLNCGLI